MAVTAIWGKDRTGQPGRLNTMTRATIRATTSIIQRIGRPAAIRNLIHMPLSLTGTALIDTAAYHLGTGWGLLATGASLWILEHIAADE